MMSSLVLVLAVCDACDAMRRLEHFVSYLLVGWMHNSLHIPSGGQQQMDWDRSTGHPICLVIPDGEEEPLTYVKSLAAPPAVQG